MNRISTLILTSLCCSAFVAAQEPSPRGEQPAEPATGRATPAAAERDGEAAERPKLVELGQKLPRPISLPNIDGEVTRSGSLLGRIVVVNFWSITCPIMKGWESRLSAIHSEYSDKDVAFLMINSNAANGEIGDAEPKEPDGEPYAKIRNFLAKNELPYEVLVDQDGSIARLFQAKTTPHIYVFDKTGTLVYRGAIDDDANGKKAEDERQNHLRDVLDALLADEKVEPYETRQVGCAIKPARAKVDGAERGDAGRDGSRAKRGRSEAGGEEAGRGGPERRSGGR